VASNAPAATPSNTVDSAVIAAASPAAVTANSVSVDPANLVITFFPISSNLVAPPVLINRLPYARDPANTPPTVDSLTLYSADTFVAIFLISAMLASPPLF